MIPALTRFRKFLQLSLLLLFGAVLSACQATMGTGPQVGQSVRVAMLLPYGSPNAGDDLLASSLENAARLAAAEAVGTQIELVVYPTQADAGTAAAVAQQAVAEGADVILGPLRSDAAAAVGVAVANTNVSVLSFSNNASIAGRNLFVLGLTYDNAAARMVSYAAANGRDRIMVVHARNLAGEVARDAVRRAAAASGATVLGEIAYEFSQTGVVAALPEVEALVAQTGANAMILTADASGALPLFGQLLPDNGFDTEATKIIGLTRWDIPAQTLEIRGLQGGWFVLPDPNAESAFRTRYQLAYQQAPHNLARCD
ncbi:MAG: ABC transporter substrate-binding protein [Paracoccaceae bacterium]